jgi:hypothetical protein
MDDRGIAAWKLPLIVGAIAVSIVGGFYLGGPGLGMAVGALAASTIVIWAVRHPPPHPIVPAPVRDLREHLLVVVDEPLENGAAVERIAGAAAAADPDRPEAEVRVVAPVRNRFLDRWASDPRGGHDRAQRSLVLSLASLAQAGVEATARVGDEGIVQTVADQLQVYPATEVFLVTGSGGEDSIAAAEELRSRLRAPFQLVPQPETSASAQTSSTSRSHSGSTPRVQP